MNFCLQFEAVELAIETCTKLNQWDKALQLSNQYMVKINVGELFSRHISQLLQQGRILDAVQSYRKADQFLEAAELLFEVGSIYFLEVMMIKYYYLLMFAV